MRHQLERPSSPCTECPHVGSSTVIRTKDNSSAKPVQCSVCIIETCLPREVAFALGCSIPDLQKVWWGAGRLFVPMASQHTVDCGSLWQSQGTTNSYNVAQNSATRLQSCSWPQNSQQDHFSIAAYAGVQNTLAASSLIRSAVPNGWKGVGLAPQNK